MKEPGSAIRDGYYNLLNGNITYNGSNVPVFKDDPIATTPDHYIVIASIIENQDNNNQKFVNDISVNVDIFTTMYKTITRDIVDNISNQVLNLVMPTTSTWTLSATNFQIITLRRENSTYLNEQNGDYHIVRKILTFNQTLIEV